MIQVNGIREVFRDESVATMLARMSIDARGVAVALNGEVVVRSQWSTTRLSDEMIVEIVTAVAGG